MSRKVYDVAIIGAGAAGIICAITAARKGIRPVLLEHMPEPAKKILATGNGRCNYTNASQGLENYYCEDPAFVDAALSQFSYQDTIYFFEQLGIRPVQKNGTCIYPESGQAAAVRSALLFEVKRLGIPVLMPVGIRTVISRSTTINPKSRRLQGVSDEGGFEIHTKTVTVKSRTCVLAAGGKAAKKTGSDGSGYVYARQFGHTITTPLPALGALNADYSKWKLPSGIRIACMAFLYIDGTRVACEQGELQITDYGVSGIVVFQFSRLAARALAEQKKTEVVFDFKPDMSMEELICYLQNRFQSIYHIHKSLEECLLGFIPDKLIPVIVGRSGIDAGKACKTCSQSQIKRIALQLKQYEVTITGTRDFSSSQATAGGVPVSEITAGTMESKIVPGLYFAGEIIDVDAKCGGYNLQWAWSSGYAAGAAAARSFDIHELYP